MTSEWIDSYLSNVEEDQKNVSVKWKNIRKTEIRESTMDDDNSWLFIEENGQRSIGSLEDKRHHRLCSLVCQVEGRGRCKGL